MGAFQLMKATINKDKRIGKVIFLVEGDVDEVEIIKHIFYDVLNYTIHLYDKRINKWTCLKNNKDKFSNVYIAPMQTPAIKNIASSLDYIDFLFKNLKQLNLHQDNCFTYFLFDRDRESNKLTDVENAIRLLKNSQDNGEEMNGLLLISYPCSQAFICNCNNVVCDIEDSKQLKNIAESFLLKKINKVKIKDGCEYMLQIIKKITGLDFSETDLDDFSTLSLKILEKENIKYRDEHKFHVLSLIFTCLLDLGIIKLNK